MPRLSQLVLEHPLEYARVMGWLPDGEPKAAADAPAPPSDEESESP